MADIRVRVGYWAESDKSYSLLVDVFYDDKGKYTGAGRAEWFPKSVCTLEKVEIKNHLPEYYLTAPEWILKQKKVKYEL